MTTTTTATKPIRSPKYPSWSIEKTSATSYLMVRDAGIFAASVRHTADHGWEATLLTKQSGTWKPAKTPCVHCALGVVTEAERRANVIMKYERKGLVGART